MHDGMGDTLSFLLCRVGRCGCPHAARQLLAAGFLLNGVREFVCYQLFALGRLRRVLSLPENDVLANSVCKSIDGLGRGCSPFIGMYTHLAEVVRESRLHEGTCALVKRLAGRAEHVLDDGRDGVRRCGRHGGPLYSSFALLTTRCALTIFVRVLTTGAAQKHPRYGR